ncbi:MAG: DUF4026 domain-containing protein [Lachnospiraceae bacterium]|nr:DUF4026 domain-containing protein [Lachnospiraceae bacterium]
MQEDSMMIAIPRDSEDFKDPEVLKNNLDANESTNVLSFELDQYERFEIKLTIDGRLYTIWLSLEPVEIPRFIRMDHQFSKKDVEVLQKVTLGLGVNMIYNGDSRICFYDQIRIINILVPDVVAVMDIPSEKLLSGKWLALAAQSKVMPAPRYLFTVQAVYGDETDEVWLHTHGLKRCGLYELEILDSNKDSYEAHYQVIETMAYIMIESEEGVNPGEPVFNAHLSNGDILVTTAVEWKEALHFYPDIKFGKNDDRDEYHSDDYYALMAYANYDDSEMKIYTKLQDYENDLTDNPVFLVSTSETERMSALARERISYLIFAFENLDCKCVAKIGLETDPEYREENEKEHIWFDVKGFKDGKIIGELTQEPYFVSGIKIGDVGTYSLSDVTDWLILTEETRITPDDVYLIAK